MKKTFLVVILLFILCGCSIGKPQTQNKQFFAMNTIIDVTVFTKDKQVLNDIQQKINEIENLMSVNITASDVNKINSNAGIKPIAVNELTYKVIKTALKYQKLSNNSFQITIYPLVKLWNISSDSESIPTQDQIAEARQYCNTKYLQINDEQKSVYLTNKNAGIDLGAIAKGYAADKIIDILNDKGIEHALISLGGGIQAIGGKQNNEPWVLGLENPIEADKGYFATCEIYNGALVTSGDYQRFKVVNGVKYHHIIDSKTGYPVNNKLASVSIFTNSSINADAISTATYALGLKEGYNFINELENVEAMFVTHDKLVYITEGLKNKISIVDKEFIINEIR